MKRHVKFLEHSNDKSRLYHKRLLLPLRPLGFNNIQAGKANFFVEKPPGSLAANVPEDDIKAIYIPKTITAAPFLQHSGLTPGQKRFLHNIAEAYSKEHMRQLICQHYMNVLHRCITTVPDDDPVAKPQIPSYIPEVKQTAASQITSKSKTKENGKRTSSSIKKTTLPKIIHNQRLSSEYEQIKTAHSKKRRATIANPASLRRSDPWEAPGMDSYLAGHMSSLSFNELEEDQKDFLYLD